jgi:hypothetical protein
MGNVKHAVRKVVINMWWMYIVVVAVLAFGAYAFLTFVGFQTRGLTRKTDRSAENMYDQFAGSPGKRHRRS